MVAFRPNRRILWKKRLDASTGGWPGSDYAEPVEIPARVALKGRMASGAGIGEEARAINNIVVEEGVGIGDLLNLTDTTEENYEEVEARESVEDVAGNTLRFVCYLDPVTRS